MGDDAKELFHSRFLRIWHVPSLFSIGISVDTSVYFVTIEIGTLQFVFGR